MMSLIENRTSSHNHDYDCGQHSRGQVEVVGVSRCRRERRTGGDLQAESADRGTARDRAEADRTAAAGSGEGQNHDPSIVLRTDARRMARRVLQRPGVPRADQADRRAAQKAPASALALMKLLLDSCTFLWIAGKQEKLSPRAAGLFQSAENEVYLSAASVWEIGIKYQDRRLTL